MAYTNAAVILARGLRGHRGPRRTLLRLRRRERAATTTHVAVRGRRQAAPRASRAAAGAGAVERPGAGRRRAAGARRAARDESARHRRRAPANPEPTRATRRCSTRAACSRSSSGTSPATRRRWSSRSAASRRTVPRGRRGRSPRTRGRERTTAFVLRGRLDPAHASASSTSARAAILQLLLGNIGPPGRRHPGAARPREHPGLHRHPDAVQPPPRLPPDAARAPARDLDNYVAADAARPASGATCAPTR